MSGVGESSFCVKDFVQGGEFVKKTFESVQTLILLIFEITMSDMFFVFFQLNSKPNTERTLIFQ